MINGRIRHETVTLSLLAVAAVGIGISVWLWPVQSRGPPLLFCRISSSVYTTLPCTCVAIGRPLPLPGFSPIFFVRSILCPGKRSTKAVCISRWCSRCDCGALCRPCILIYSPAGSVPTCTTAHRSGSGTRTALTL